MRISRNFPSIRAWKSKFTFPSCWKLKSWKTFRHTPRPPLSPQHLSTKQLKSTTAQAHRAISLRLCREAPSFLVAARLRRFRASTPCSSWAWRLFKFNEQQENCSEHRVNIWPQVQRSSLPRALGSSWQRPGRCPRLPSIRRLLAPPRPFQPGATGCGSDGPPSASALCGLSKLGGLFLAPSWPWCGASGHCGPRSLWGPYSAWPSGVFWKRVARWWSRSSIAACSGPGRRDAL